MTSPTSTTVTLGAIVNAIEGVLDDATGLSVSQTYTELTENIPDTPLLQVYPESCTGTDSQGGNDRTTFKAGVRQTEYVIHADLYALQRGPGIGEEMGRLTPLIDAITTQLESQKTGNLFGLSTIKAYRWRWDRVQFEYANCNYVGARFIITITVY